MPKRCPKDAQKMPKRCPKDAQKMPKTTDYMKADVFVLPAELTEWYGYEVVAHDQLVREPNIGAYSKFWGFRESFLRCSPKGYVFDFAGQASLLCDQTQPTGVLSRWDGQNCTALHFIRFWFPRPAAVTITIQVAREHDPVCSFNCYSFNVQTW